jgi:hypothetical protein
METQLRYSVALLPKLRHPSNHPASRHRVARSELGYRRKNLGDAALGKTLIESLFASDTLEEGSVSALDAEPEDPEPLPPL